MAIKKSNIIRFVELEKNRAVKESKRMGEEELNAFRSALMKDSPMQEQLTKCQTLLDKLHAEIAVLQPIVEEKTYSLNSYYNNRNYLDLYDNIIVQLLSNRELKELEKARKSVAEATTEVMHTYSRVITTIKGMTSIKSMLAYLKSLGFDTSSIPENDVPLVGKVDVSLLLIDKKGEANE